MSAESRTTPRDAGAHECGQFNYAFGCTINPSGKPSCHSPAPSLHRCRSVSREYVAILVRQKHPDEDFAETFAVWRRRSSIGVAAGRPHSNWVRGPRVATDLCRRSYRRPRMISGRGDAHRRRALCRERRTRPNRRQRQSEDCEDSSRRDAPEGELAGRFIERHRRSSTIRRGRARPACRSLDRPSRPAHRAERSRRRPRSSDTDLTHLRHRRGREPPLHTALAPGADRGCGRADMKFLPQRRCVGAALRRSASSAATRRWRARA